MAIDFQEVVDRANNLIDAAIVVRGLAATAERGTEKETGEPLATVTIQSIKTVKGPAARTAAQSAWDALNAAMTP